MERHDSGRVSLSPKRHPTIEDCYCLREPSGIRYCIQSPTAANGGPKWTVDRTVFEMWLGAL